MVLRGAPNPNAAQVLAAFMVSEAGQAAVNRHHPAALDGVEGAMYGMDGVRPAEAVAALSVDGVAEQKSWCDELFKR